MTITIAQWMAVAAEQGVSVLQVMAQVQAIDAPSPDRSSDLILYRDRDGHPLTLGQWAVLNEGISYRFVKETLLSRSGIWVATIWMGVVDPLEHHLFETTVFSRKALNGRVALEDERYATEAQALAGHDRLVRKWAAK